MTPFNSKHNKKILNMQYQFLYMLDLKSPRWKQRPLENRSNIFMRGQHDSKNAISHLTQQICWSQSTHCHMNDSPINKLQALICYNCELSTLHYT
jgi:hypothetical protein